MSEATVEQVIGAIRDLATSLEGPAKHVYEIYVRQAYVSGASMFVVMMLAIALSYAVVHWLWRSSEDSCDEGIVKVFAGLGMLGVLCGCGYQVAMNIPKILNPEFYAMSALLRNLGGGM